MFEDNLAFLKYTNLSCVPVPLVHVHCLTAHLFFLQPGSPSYKRELPDENFSSPHDFNVSCSSSKTSQQPASGFTNLLYSFLCHNHLKQVCRKYAVTSATATSAYSLWLSSFPLIFSFLSEQSLQQWSYCTDAFSVLSSKRVALLCANCRRTVATNQRTATKIPTSTE